MRKTSALRFVALILLMVCLLSSMVFSVHAAEKPLTDVLADAKQGVVQIYGLGYDRQNNPEANWIGSGFCVGNTENGNGIFVTNWHVATGDGEYDEDHVRIWILKENCGIRDTDYQPDPGKSIECTIRSTTYGHPDYAIVETKVSATEYEVLPLCSSKEIAVGETVYALGYPGSVTEHSVTSSGTDDITVTNGIVSQHLQDAYADETWVLMHTALISGGNSGGPLITEQGAVIGVNTYLFDDDRYCAVYIDYIMDALDQESISYQKYGKDTPGGTTSGGEENVNPKDSRKLSPVGTMIILILPAAAGVAVFFAVFRKKPSEKADKKESGHIKVSEYNKENENKKQEADDVTKPIGSGQGSRAAEAVYKLRLPDGRVVPVNKSCVTIGRDPGCDICIKDLDNKVSRHHCKLEILQGRLILSDTDSRNGTFIHGKRIPANARVALKYGSSFAIGNTDHVITVC